VTFARNSNTFYATLKTDGKTYLVKGDLGLRKLTVLHENLECPSLSPNNRLIAFKKRTGPDLAPWRIYVLDLATMVEHPIEGETRSVDDQLEWLDDEHVLYGMRRSSPRRRRASSCRRPTRRSSSGRRRRPRSRRPYFADAVQRAALSAGPLS